MTSNFLNNTRAEFIKIRSTPAIWITILSAALIPLLNFIVCIRNADRFVRLIKPDPWDFFLLMNWDHGASFVLPIFVIFITSLIVQIEYRNNTWKQVYTSPRTYRDIFFSKFIVIQFLLISFFLFFNIFMLVSGWMVDLLKPDYGFTAHTPVSYKTLTMTARIYAGILPVTAIQYWLCFRSPSFITPIAIGLVLLGIDIALTDHISIYYPYKQAGLMFSTALAKHTHDLLAVLLSSLLWFLLSIIGGVFTINNLKQRG